MDITLKIFNMLYDTPLWDIASIQPLKTALERDHYVDVNKMVDLGSSSVRSNFRRLKMTSYSKFAIPFFTIRNSKFTIH